jgi:hypothetical protein
MTRIRTRTSTSAREEALSRRVTSLRVDAGRARRMWAMQPDERVQAAEQGQLSLGEMLQWARRAPHEVPIVDGEFFFITRLAE